MRLELPIDDKERVERIRMMLNEFERGKPYWFGYKDRMEILISRIARVARFAAKKEHK